MKITIKTLIEQDLEVLETAKKRLEKAIRQADYTSIDEVIIWRHSSAPCLVVYYTPDNYAAPLHYLPEEVKGKSGEELREMMEV